MTERPSCKNCEEALVKIKHGYHCPNCHSLYTKELKMVWDGAKMSRVIVLKVCKYSGCGKELVQKPNEHPAVFKKRVYCDTRCAIAGQREAKHWRHDGWLTMPSKDKDL